LFPQAEQDLALAVQRGVGGVQVPLSAAAVAGAGAADEPDDVAVQVVHGEHDPVAEHVDQPAGAGAGGQPGGEQLGVGELKPAQVVDQPGPRGRGRSRRPTGRRRQA
jgi:hypothetical protein